MLIPEVQKKINAAFDGLNLSDERRAILQPLIEKHVQISRRDSEDENFGYEVDVVDSNGIKREGIKLSDLVKEINTATAATEIPSVENKNLTPEQLQLIADGKLGIKEEKTPKVKDAIPSSKLKDHKNVSLEDIASGKQPIDINA